jgi:hypothetical protein
MGSTCTRGNSRTTSAPFTVLHPPRLKSSMGRSPGSGQCGCSICIETTRRDQMRPALDVVAGQTPFRAQPRSWTVRRQPDPSRCSAPRLSSVSACVKRLRMTHADTGAGSNQHRVNTRPGRIFQGMRRQYSSQAASYCTMWRRLALGPSKMALSTANAAAARPAVLEAREALPQLSPPRETIRGSWWRFLAA